MERAADVIHDLPQAVAALPRPAQRKYQDLCAALADAEALARTAIEREKVAEERVHGIERRLNMARRGQPVDTGKLKELEVDYRELLSEHDRLNSERNKRNSARGNAEQVLSQLKAIRHTIYQSRKAP